MRTPAPWTPAAAAATRRCHALGDRLLLTAAGLAWAAAAAAAPADFVSTKPTQRVEYWQQRQAQIDAALRESRKLPAVKLVFLGDSITDFWLLGDDPWVPGQLHGLKVWNETFAGANPQLTALNLGISGDRLEHVLFRLLPRSAGGLGHLDAPALQPDFIVLMLGINNTWAPEQPVVASIVAGVRAVLLASHERKPDARIVLQSVLPTNDASKNRDVVLPINRALAMLTADPAFKPYTTWLDLYPGFVDSNGRQIGRLFMKDGLHPAEPGYRVWRDRLLPALERARSAAR